MAWLMTEMIDLLMAGCPAGDAVCSFGQAAVIRARRLVIPMVNIEEEHPSTLGRFDFVGPDHLSEKKC